MFYIAILQYFWQFLITVGVNIVILTHIQ